MLGERGVGVGRKTVGPRRSAAAFELPVKKSEPMLVETQTVDPASSRSLAEFVSLPRCTLR